MWNPGRAQPAFGLRITPWQGVRPDVFGVGELRNVQQLRPLLPSDDSEPLAIVRHVGTAHHLECGQHFGLCQAVGIGAGKVCRCIQRGDDQLIGFATQGLGTGIGDDLPLVDVDLHLIQFVDPVAGIEVRQNTLHRGVIDGHHRHQTMA